jgi:hypothetical protein
MLLFQPITGRVTGKQSAKDPKCFSLRESASPSLSALFFILSSPIALRAITCLKYQPLDSHINAMWLRLHLFRKAKSNTKRSRTSGKAGQHLGLSVLRKAGFSSFCAYISTKSSKKRMC